MSKALRLVAPLDHALAHQLDRGGILGSEKGHACRCARIEGLFALLAQQVAHLDRDVAKVDVHRAGFFAAVADGAVVGDVLELGPVRQRDAAPGLLFVEEGFDQQRGAEDLVARAVHQVGTRHMGGAHRLALAAAQAILDVVGNLVDLGLFHDQRFVSHQPEAWRVRVVEVAR